MLEFPSTRTAPDLIVRRLRAVNPAAEVVWIDLGEGRGEWWYGVLKPNPVRERTGVRMMVEASRAGDQLRATYLQGKLMKQGFAWYGACPLWDLPSTVVDEFAAQEYASMVDCAREYDQACSDADGTTRKQSVDARLRDFADAEGKSIYKNKFRRRVFFS